MYDINDLERSTGYSKDQLRDRLSALAATFAHDRQQGPRNKTLVGDATLAVLRRLKELEDGGLSPNVAHSQALKELGDGGLVRVPTVGNSPLQSPTVADVLMAERDHLKALLRAKDDELERVMGLLEQAQAMLPASSATRQRLGRWAALRAVVTGRV